MRVHSSFPRNRPNPSIQANANVCTVFSTPHFAQLRSSEALPFALFPSNSPTFSIPFVPLSFSFRFTAVGTAGNNANNFRFGLHSSNATLITADNTTESDNDQGYYFAIGSGTSSPGTNTTLFNEGGGTAVILGGTDRAAITTLAGPGINDNFAHTFVMTLTRTSATNIAASLILDNGSPITGNDTTANKRTTFDEIAFGTGFSTNTVSINIDNVSVEYVPEPAALTLIGLAGAFLLPRRRPRN